MLRESQQVMSPFYKIILSGQSGVGKTCLLSMYVKGVCSNPFPTIAVEFCTKEVRLNDGTIARIQLWDTAGQERFKSIANSYYRKANGVLLLFDITVRESFESCVEFIKDIRENSDISCKIYLVGNKIDLEDQRLVSTEEARKFAKKNGCEYFETSAVQNQGVSDVFLKLMNEIHELKKNSPGEESSNKHLNIDKDSSSNFGEEILQTQQEQRRLCCQ